MTSYYSTVPAAETGVYWLDRSPSGITGYHIVMSVLGMLKSDVLDLTRQIAQRFSLNKTDDYGFSSDGATFVRGTEIPV